MATAAVCRGRTSHLAVSGSFPLADPFRETGAFIPCALGAADRAAMLETATAASAALGITTGALHTEIKLTPDGPRVIEVNGRIAGFVPALLPRSTGVDMIALVMRGALGEEVAFDELPASGAVAYNLRMQAPRGVARIVEIAGLEQLRQGPAVDVVSLDRAPGDRVDLRLGTSDSVVTVIGSVANHDELRSAARRAQAMVRIRGE